MVSKSKTCFVDLPFRKSFNSLQFILLSVSHTTVRFDNRQIGMYALGLSGNFLSLGSLLSNSIVSFTTIVASSVVIRFNPGAFNFGAAS